MSNRYPRVTIPFPETNVAEVQDAMVRWLSANRHWRTHHVAPALDGTFVTFENTDDALPLGPNARKNADAAED